MATLTSKFGLRKPAGADFVSPTLDIGDNMDKIDGALGLKKLYRKVDGNMVITATAPGVPIGGAGSSLTALTMKANVGDWVEVVVNGLWDSTAIFAYLDVWSRVTGTLFKSWGGNIASAFVAGHAGVPAWRCDASALRTPAGGVLRALEAGDLDAGYLTTVLASQVGSSSKYLYAVDAIPFQYYVINHGQP